MTPLVSVCIVSYNQQAFIRDCLESVVGQETDFPFEVIVGDDCSGDGTRDIIYEFAASNHPRLRVISHPFRIGATPNMMAVHNSAVGEFIAHLDGDDLMLPGKLQEQADFLRTHADHALVAHDMEVIDRHSRIISPSFGGVGIPRSADLEFLVANGCYFAHSSKMHRRSAVRTTQCEKLTVDFYFHIEQALSGSIGYIDRPLGRYRRTGDGITAAGSPMQTAVLQGHLDAYEFALSSGVRQSVVFPALLNFRYVNIMRSLRFDRPEQVDLLRSGMTSSEMKFSSVRQRVVLMSPTWAVGLGARLFDRAFGRRRVLDGTLA